MINSVVPSPTTPSNNQPAIRPQSANRLIDSIPELMLPVAQQTQASRSSSLSTSTSEAESSPKSVSPRSANRLSNLPLSIQMLAALRQSVHRGSLKMHTESKGQSMQAHLVASRSVDSPKTQSQLS